MDNELAVATTDKNGNDVYELIVSEDKTNVHVKVTASGNNAMVSGDYLGRDRLGTKDPAANSGWWRRIQEAGN